MEGAESHTLWVTQSRRGDLLLCGLVLLAMVVLSVRLRVYYWVLAGDVRVVRILADGSRQPLPTPDTFRRVGGFLSEQELVDQVERRIRRYMTDPRTRPNSEPPGTRYQWTLRWSMNSARLDNQRVIVIDAESAQQF